MLISINVGDYLLVTTTKNQKKIAGTVVYVFPGLVIPKPVIVKKYFGINAPKSAFRYSENKRYVIQCPNTKKYYSVPHHHNKFVITGVSDATGIKATLYHLNPERMTGGFHYE